MGFLTTHVLDTANGCPASGMTIRLYQLQGTEATLLKTIQTNADGRADAPLLDGASFAVGRYRLVFAVAGYFAARSTSVAEVPFLSDVPLDFGIADASAHYHVPLLVSPWSYSTYRGS